MSSLSEIEAAADALPRRQKEHLLAFLAARLGRTIDGTAAKKIPEISDVALDQFDAEIEKDRKKGRLKKLGNTARSAATKLRILTGGG